MRQEWSVIGAFSRNGQTLYFHCNRWPGTELAIGGLTCKVVEARLMGGRKVKFTQARDRLVLYGLPKEAPDPLVSVIELKVKGTPKQVLGPGMVVFREDPRKEKGK